MNGSPPKLKAAVARMINDDVLQSSWQRLRAFTKDQGIPIFVTWNGLDSAFPFLIERSSVPGVKLPLPAPGSRAPFQLWKHLDLFAELATYDQQPHVSLQLYLAAGTTAFVIHLSCIQTRLRNLSAPAEPSVFWECSSSETQERA